MFISRHNTHLNWFFFGFCMTYYIFHFLSSHFGSNISYLLFLGYLTRSPVWAKSYICVYIYIMEHFTLSQQPLAIMQVVKLFVHISNVCMYRYVFPQRIRTQASLRTYRNLYSLLAALGFRLVFFQYLRIWNKTQNYQCFAIWFTCTMVPIMEQWDIPPTMQP